MILVTCPKSECTWKKQITLKRNLSRSIDNHVKVKHAALWKEHVASIKRNKK